MTGTQSAIYVGTLRHRRFLPVGHEFRTSIFMMYLDLDELPKVFSGRWFWSIDHFNLATFRRRDHIGDPTQPLSDTIRDLVESKTNSRPTGSIRLLTHCSYFGYCFNPLSIYFCFEPSDSDGRGVELLHSIVAEVTNTPWRERHCYVLRAAPVHENVGPIDSVPAQSKNYGPNDFEPNSVKYSFRFLKAFHVSPFMEMDTEYRWLLKGPGKHLTLHTENWQNDKKYFDVSLVMHRKAISTGTLAWVLIRFPLMTIQVIANIHWQALRLWWKKVPYIPHPGACQTDVVVKNIGRSNDDNISVTK